MATWLPVLIGVPLLALAFAMQVRWRCWLLPRVEDRPGGGAHNDTLRADLTTHNADPSPQPGGR